MDQRAKCKTKTIKLLQESIRTNLHSLGFGDSFLEMTPRAQVTKEK
jgi:hypothetical protein